MSTKDTLSRDPTSSNTVEFETKETFFTTLSPEIIDYILDIAALPRIRGALCILYLVSRAMYYLASARLYRNILLERDIEMSRFQNTLFVCPSRGHFTHALTVRFTRHMARIISLEELLCRLPNLRILILREPPSSPRLPIAHPTLRCVSLGSSLTGNFEANFPHPCSYITHFAVGCLPRHLGDQLRLIQFEQLTHILLARYTRKRR
ncbi:hypothetical protein DL96DRAFT_1016085 [Flagelloscypha sp. PMI_526]|nr:hypothetical protein DL96DRAFT_1016085 [Flagelloscypha sp. PMI_526]